MIAVKALSNQHSITTLCRVLRVNRSTYYKWLRRSPSVREHENRSVRAAVLELCAKTDKRLGPRKIKDCFNRDYCINISCGRVYRLPKALINPLRIWFGYVISSITDRRNCKSLGELYHSIFTYINGFYNSVRPHSHNNGLSPNQKEALFMPVWFFCCLLYWHRSIPRFFYLVLLITFSWIMSYSFLSLLQNHGFNILKLTLCEIMYKFI